MPSKESLFDQGVSAAKAAFDLSGAYVCPLCQRNFDATALVRGELTLEHVPPRALGGKKLILTCKLCNNTAGHTVDAAAAGREAQNSFNRVLLQGDHGNAGRATITWGGEQLAADVSVDEFGVTELRIIGELNDPARVAAAARFMEKLREEGRTGGHTFQVTSVRKYIPRLARISDLRSAFLALTAKFGYKYASHLALEKVRRQILHPTDSILETWWFDGHADFVRRNIMIFVSDGFASVTFGDRTNLLPWPSVNNYDKVMTPISEREIFSLSNPILVEWPQSFEALLDHSRATLRAVQEMDARTL